jgi:hypothetical protein
MDLNLMDLNLTVKDYFEAAAKVKAADDLIESEEPAKPQASTQTSVLTPDAHNAMVALAQHRVVPTLTPAQEKDHYNLIASELLGTPEAPGYVIKYASKLANRLGVDPDELVSQFASGRVNKRSGKHATKGSGLPIIDTVLKHGHKLLDPEGKTTPKSLENRLRSGMKRAAVDLLRDRGRRHQVTIFNNNSKGERVINPAAELGKEQIGSAGYGTYSASRQREPGPLRSVIHNEQQKKMDDLMQQHIDQLNSKYKEGSKDLHPDVVHSILRDHLFNGLSLPDIVKKYKQHVPTPPDAPEQHKVPIAARNKIHRVVSQFRQGLERHFDKPKEPSVKPKKSEVEAPEQVKPDSEQSQASEISTVEQPNEQDLKVAKEILSNPIPDKEQDPKGHEMFRQAASIWRKVTGQPRLPSEMETSKTKRSVFRLKTLRKRAEAKAKVDAEPENPQPATEKDHDSPRMPGGLPGMENINLASRLFGDDYANISEALVIKSGNFNG